MTRWESRQRADRLWVTRVPSLRPRLHERVLAWLLSRRSVDRSGR